MLLDKVGVNGLKDKPRLNISDLSFSVAKLIIKSIDIDTLALHPLARAIARYIQENKTTNAFNLLHHFAPFWSCHKHRTLSQLELLKTSNNADTLEWVRLSEFNQIRFINAVYLHYNGKPSNYDSPTNKVKDLIKSVNKLLLAGGVYANPN